MPPLRNEIATELAPLTPLAVALQFVAAGHPVFPCFEETVDEYDDRQGQYVERPEKSPRTSNGLKDATVNERIVKKWFDEKYPTALVGLPTGSALGAWVLDLDRHGERDGHIWLAEMEALHGPLPDTARVSTANSGTHLFFNHVEGVRNKAAIAPGVDCRGEAGYVIAAGSAMADGRRYEWIDAEGKPYEPIGFPEFADAPEWLLDLVLRKAEIEPARTAEPYQYRPANDAAPYVERALADEVAKLSATGKGSRGAQLNTSAFSLGQLVGAGVLSEEVAAAELYAACSSNGLVSTDGDKRVRSNIKRALGDGAKSPRQIPDRHFANDNTPAVDVAPFIATGLAKKERQKAAEPNDETPEGGETAESAAPSGLDIFSWPASRYVGEPAPVEYLVDGVIESGIPGMIAAMGELGKSYTLLELCRRVAFGSGILAPPILGGQVVQQGTAVFLTGEDDQRSIHRRIAAIDPRNTRFSDKGDKLIAIPLPSAVPVFQPFWTDDKGFKSTDAWLRFTDQLMGIPDLRVVVIDPLQMFAALKINDDPAAGQFVCSQIAGLAAHTGANVFFAHHMKKNSGKEKVENLSDARDAIRGTSALVDGVRVAYALWYPDEGEARAKSKAIGVEYMPNRIVHGGVVKANGAARRLMSTYARNDSGLLVDKTALASGIQTVGGDLKAALVIAIEAAAEAGQPYTKTGSAGLFALKEKLPDELSGLSRHRLEGLCTSCLEDGTVVVCTGKGDKTPKWLDVPGGLFAIGLGEFKRGATYPKRANH